MRFTVEIDMTSEAFERNACELYDCLRRLQQEFANGSSPLPSGGAVKDSDGKIAGAWTIREAEPVFFVSDKIELSEPVKAGGYFTFGYGDPFSFDSQRQWLWTNKDSVND